MQRTTNNTAAPRRALNRRWRFLAACALAAAPGAYSQTEVPDRSGSILEAALVDLRTTEELVAAVRLAGEDVVTVLAVEDVIRLALEQNPELLVVAFDPVIAERELEAARAEFDPTLAAGGAYDAARTENSRVRSLLQIAGLIDDQPAVDSSVDGLSLDAGIAGKLPTGLRYEATVSRLDQDVDVDAPGADVDIASDVARLAVTQPLLRNAGLRVNRASIRRAEVARDAADAAYYLERQETVAQAVAAYWDLAGSYAALAVRRAAVETAEQLLADTRERNALGAVSDEETLTAQSGLARRQNDLIAVVAELGRSSDRLKALLDLRAETGLTSDLLAPDAVAAAPDLEDLPLDSSPERLIETALARRPEMYLADAERRIAAINLLQRRNARLPQLDAYGEIGSREVDENYSGLVFGDRSEDTDYWTVGLRASVPIGNRRAKAEARAAMSRKDRADRAHEALATAVAEDVRLALRNLRASAATVENARKSVTLEQARLLAERERFQFGSTTAFQILLVQDDVVAEQTRLAAAEARLMAQLVNLKRAEGVLLEDLGYPTPSWLEPIDPTPAP